MKIQILKPLRWGTALFLLDGLWALLILLLRLLCDPSVDGLDSLLSRSWFVVHYYIETILAPLFFDTVYLHPQTLNETGIFLFRLLCASQSFIVGFLVSITLEAVKIAKGYRQ